MPFYYMRKTLQYLCVLKSILEFLGFLLINVNVNFSFKAVEKGSAMISEEYWLLSFLKDNMSL